MDFVRGLVVRSNAGHDKNIFHVITKICDEYAFICDGKLRKLENPKKKNLKHISATNTVLTEEQIRTDKQIRLNLARFKRK
jgi:ribosomal protein L14E/L6E/L27E